jgi:hypothetical protein
MCSMLQLRTQVVFYEEIHVFFNSAEWVYLEQSEGISSLKNLSCRNYSFQTLNQFLQGEKVLDALTSNTGGFLSRSTCISSTELHMPIWNKMSLTPH